METNTEPKNRSNTWLWVVGALAALMLLACLCVAIAGGATLLLGVVNPIRQVGPAPTMIFPTPAQVVTAIPATDTPPTGQDADDGAPDEPDADAGESAEPITAELPPRDRYDLAQRFLGISDAPPPEPKTYRLGDVETFYVDNDDTNSVIEVDAELVYIAQNVYMWVEQGVDYDLDAIAESAERFSEETVPTNREFFGVEASPGIDGDERLHVLHSVELGTGIAGYFYSPSEYPASVVPYSNEKEVFFINIGNTRPGTAIYDSVLAHEYQHMIHWHVDQNEESWMNEGLSEVAAFLNGFGPSNFAPLYLMDTDLQLNSWPEGGGGGANYGAGFLFNLYFLDRFGHDALRSVVASPRNGLAGVDDALEQLDAGVTADDVFADWAVANQLGASGGIYGYQSLDVPMTARITESVNAYPAGESNATVHQFGTDYIVLNEPGTVTITFDGQDAVSLLPTDTRDTDGDPATDDDTVWWSNRGDDSDTTLTREIDLSGVDQATLEYDAWYWIEEQWDYAYLTVSTDGGETWTVLPTPHTTSEDPHGNAYGDGYTGMSSDRPEANADGWLHETIDLSGFAGQTVLLRYEMITDDAVNQPGLAVDNICIAEIDWCDDAETDGGWQAEGFVRHNNVLPQHFAVQIAAPGPDPGTIEVIRMGLDEQNRGELTVEIPAGQSATLIVSGLTRYTTELAEYSYDIEAAGQ